MIRNQRRFSDSYRADIDGLRAVAVLLVLFFHMDIKIFQGGFIGVDVFFVISGFLITGIVCKQIQAGQFSFHEFYRRRFQRLFPALFTTLALSLVVAVFLFSPLHLEETAAALIASLFSISNIYFWQESSYFATDIIFKPLLHTWSLSVEEQFYFVWPVFLFSCMKIFSYRYTLVIISAAFITTLILTQVFIDRSVAVFFLTPFRIYEFAIGGAMVWLGVQPKNSVFQELAVFIGLALILYSAISFNNQTPFPGVNALIPCVGTAFVLWGGQAKYMGFLLRNKFSVFIGLISYSLYLVHWPLLVFYQYIILRPMTYIEMIVMLAIVIALAFLMYRYVEVPFRYGFKKKTVTKKQPVFIMVLIATLIILIPSGYILYAHGIPNRFPARIESLIKNTNRYSEESVAYDVLHQVNNFPSGIKKTKVLVVGDSHSRDILNALHMNQGLKPQTFFARFNSDETCFKYFHEQSKNKQSFLNALLGRKDKCLNEVQRFKSSSLIHGADVIFIVAKWHANDIAGLYPLAEYLQSNTRAEIVVFGRTPDLYDVPSFITRHHNLDTLNNAISKTRNDHIALNSAIQKITSDIGATYIDRLPFVCPDDCEVITQDETLLLFDGNHWTVKGAKHFGERMIKSEALRFLN